VSANQNQTNSLQDEARVILDGTTQASLSTLAASPIGGAGVGAPYASLVLVGQDPADGAPILLLSKLARHTQNLLADPCGALLLVPKPDAGQGPLEGARLTLMGRFSAIEGDSGQESVRAAYLARHHDAGLYVDFADFGFWRMTVEGAHLVAGFGKITEIPVNSLIFKRF